MLSQINAASLTFKYGENLGTVMSNTAKTIIEDQLTISKTSLGSTYNINEHVFFIIKVKNNTLSVVRNVKVYDNLGVFFIKNSIQSQFTPLTFRESAKLYISGEFFSDIKPKIICNKMTFSINSIPPESTAIIIYKVLVNNFAPLEIGSNIKNSASVSAKNISESPEVYSIINVRQIADVKIIKTICPNTILPGEILTYNFSLYNYGNIEAKNITLTDNLNPILTNVKISVNDTPLLLGEYSYFGGILSIPSLGSTYNISIPPANFRRDMTGKVLIEPGVITIKISGKI